MTKKTVSTSPAHHARTTREIGLIIRERRKHLGIDQASLGRRVGVSRQWVISIERGKSSAEIGLVLRTLSALDLALNIDLVGEAANAHEAPLEKRKRTALLTSEIDINAIVDRARKRR